MYMTMSCLRCGNMMIWLNGSISHRHDIQYYECKHCNIQVVKYPDDQIIEVEDGDRVS
jgi:transposase-like protein